MGNVKKNPSLSWIMALHCYYLQNSKFGVFLLLGRLLRNAKETRLCFLVCEEKRWIYNVPEGYFSKVNVGEEVLIWTLLSEIRCTFRFTIKWRKKKIKLKISQALKLWGYCENSFYPINFSFYLDLENKKKVFSE